MHILRSMYNIIFKGMLGLVYQVYIILAAI
jgi:hypothetical protein